MCDMHVSRINATTALMHGRHVRKTICATSRPFSPRLVAEGMRKGTRSSVGDGRVRTAPLSLRLRSMVRVTEVSETSVLTGFGSLSITFITSAFTCRMCSRSASRRWCSYCKRTAVVSRRMHAAPG